MMFRGSRHGLGDLVSSEEEKGLDIWSSVSMSSVLKWTSEEIVSSMGKRSEERKCIK